MALATDLICDGREVLLAGAFLTTLVFSHLVFASLSLLFDVHARGGAFVRGAAGKIEAFLAELRTYRLLLDCLR
jgi:hypothetical protein